jgi:hypothetical protein
LTILYDDISGCTQTRDASYRQIPTVWSNARPLSTLGVRNIQWNTSGWRDVGQTNDEIVHTNTFQSINASSLLYQEQNSLSELI